MVNPDKYIRKAYVDMCNEFVTTWEAGVPKNIIPVPPTYAIISNQTRNPTERSKCGYEWMCSITVDINHVRNVGYFGSAIVDDIEESIINVLESDQLVVPGFVVKQTRFIQSQPLTASSSTQTITRKVLVYEHWLNNVD